MRPFAGARVISGPLLNFGKPLAVTAPDFINANVRTLSTRDSTMLLVFRSRINTVLPSRHSIPFI